MTNRIPGVCIGVLLLLWSSSADPVAHELSERRSRPVQEEAKTPDSLDSHLDAATQAKCGLDELEQEERDSLSAILQGYANTIASLETMAQLRRQDEADARALGWRPARVELETQGYRQMQAAVVRVDNKDYLVVRKTFRETATSDLPFTFPSSLFREGSYWCEDAPLGGIRSIIVDGRVHRFTFATWKDL